MHFLKEKSEAFECLKQFKVIVQKPSGCSILTLRTDRGGEFISKKFNNLFSNYGIQRKLTTSYTLQQNGVADWKNRTIVKTTRSMLRNKSLPKKFGAKAVAVAQLFSNSIHQRNKSL